MKQGKIEKQIYETLESKGALLFCLIDPMDYESEDVIISTSKMMSSGGSDVLLIGGSTEVQGEILDTPGRGIVDAAEHVDPIVEGHSLGDHRLFRVLDEFDETAVVHEAVLSRPARFRGRVANQNGNKWSAAAA